jgi:hypothetical protein
MSTVIHYRLLEENSALDGIYKVYDKNEVVEVPKVGDSIPLEAGTVRVTAVDDQIVPLVDAPSGHTERREIMIHLER